MCLSLCAVTQDILTFSREVHPGCAMRDLSQSITRLVVSSRAGNRHVAPTQLPRQLLWIESPFGLRLLLGREALTMQGFPTAKVSSLLNEAGETFMQDLSGNMMSLPIVLAMVMPLFTSLSWAESCATIAPPASDSDVDAALGLFNALFEGK